MEDLTAVVDTNTMCPSNKKKKHQYRYMSDEPPDKTQQINKMFKI